EHLPTGGPVEHLPTGGPVEHLPTGRPVEHLPTGRPCRAPAHRPARRAPAAAGSRCRKAPTLLSLVCCLRHHDHCNHFGDCSNTVDLAPWCGFSCPCNDEREAMTEPKGFCLCRRVGDSPGEKETPRSSPHRGRRPAPGSGGSTISRTVRKPRWRAGHAGLTCRSCLIGELGCMKDKDVPGILWGCCRSTNRHRGGSRPVSSESGVRRFGTGCGVWRGVHVSIHG
ncbi:MAG: hypothetical protein QOF10_2024, partial [Kribbellaceae bacterium]|nr:hypothetical protein [Kribbellaceae bacterium]